MGMKFHFYETKILKEFISVMQITFLLYVHNRSCMMKGKNALVWDNLFKFIFSLGVEDRNKDYMLDFVIAYNDISKICFT